MNGMLNIQVLIIEDDVKIAEINRRFVEKVPGYEVVGIAADEFQAKELLRIIHPDLVLLDVYFPDMNGIDLLMFIQKEHPKTDVIMITASRELDTVSKVIRSGVFDFIIKPIVFERFESTLLNYREYLNKMLMLSKEDKQRVSQEDVDLLLHGVNSKVQREPFLPKGIDKLTLQKVNIALNDRQKGITAEEVGRIIGASRSTARRYLEFMVSSGEIVADISYGAVGRPERVYYKT